MKILYAGTPEFAVAPLKALLDGGHDVAAVLTQEDRPAGRKAALTPPPVKVFAKEHGLPVLQPRRVRMEADMLRRVGADLMVTCAYGQILSQEILDIFPQGVWNIHASLLPAYRGAAPIQWAVINGESHTGITVMKTEAGLDTGDILLVRRTAIGAAETAGELSQRLSVLGAEAIVEGVRLIENGETQLLLQNEAKATYAKKLTKADARISWEEEGRKIVCMVLGMNPSPLAFFLSEGQTVNVFRASFAEHAGDEPCGTMLKIGKEPAVRCRDGAVVLEEIQFAGGRPMDGTAALNGRKLRVGAVLQ